METCARAKQRFRKPLISCAKLFVTLSQYGDRCPPLDSGETLDLSLRKVYARPPLLSAVCTYLVSVAARTRPSAAQTRSLFMIDEAIEVMLCKMLSEIWLAFCSYQLNVLRCQKENQRTSSFNMFIIFDLPFNALVCCYQPAPSGRQLGIIQRWCDELARDFVALLIILS